MSQKVDPIVCQAICRSLKTEIVKLEWWDEVQDDVKARLGWIIDHVDVAGSFFCQTFLMLFRWEFERRRIEKKNPHNPMAGYLSSMLGMRIPEEAYQCGMLPTRAVLDLYDYIEPTDSDVAACMFLCNKIEALERAGMLAHEEVRLSATAKDLADAFRSSKAEKAKKTSRPLRKPPQEKIEWDFNEEE